MYVCVYVCVCVEERSTGKFMLQHAALFLKADMQAADQRHLKWTSPHTLLLATLPTNICSQQQQ